MTLLQDTVCLPPKENLLDVLVSVITLQATPSTCTGYYYLKYITENTAHKYIKPQDGLGSHPGRGRGRGEEVAILLAVSCCRTQEPRLS